MTDQAEYEVVRSVAGGWGVRRVGEAQNLSHHDTREQAEAAARMHSQQGEEIDVRKDVIAEDPEQAVDARRTFGLVTLMSVGVAVLIALIAIFLVLTDTTV